MSDDRSSTPPAHDRSAPPDLPPVSVIMITRGRHDQAEKAVESLLACDYPASRREIIVVEETAHPHPIGGDGVRYVPLPEQNRGYAFARNTGLSHASCDLCAFIDDDCIADTSWLLELVQGMASHPDAGAMGGAVRVPPCGPVGQCENILGFPGGGVKYVHESRGTLISRPTFSTCNCIVRTGAIRKTGGFDERLRFGGEDEMLSRKIAAKSAVLYSPRAVVYHTPRDSVSGVFRWFVRRGKARAAAATLYSMPGRETTALITNSLFLRMTTAVGLFVLLRIALLPALLLLGGFYYLIQLWRYRWSRRFFPSPITLLCLPLVKLVMDAGYDIGMAAGRARGGR
ncbi:MAG: glycosyltransferase [Chitinispirillaceae bacterium]|nr:glycosyltransferase [Chitinispirillaceae bacterium]